MSKVDEAMWLIRTMTADELVELKARLGDSWLPPPEGGVREPVHPRGPAPSLEAGAAEEHSQPPQDPGWRYAGRKHRGMKR